MRYYIFTLGCQMNESDSQKIASVLNSCGLKATSEKEADLIIINACSVRQSAVDRIYGKLRRWQSAGGRKKVFITGCVLPKDKEKLSKKIEKIFPITDLNKLPLFLAQIYDKNFYSSKNRRMCSKNNSSLVPIISGCDNFCTYCAVPYTRGREASRPEKEIICEFESLVKHGAKEITLLGQNVNTYKPSFVELLKKIIKIPGDFKIKFLTSNPWDFPKKLIDLIAKEPKLSKEIHLPVQSGDDEILRRMNRPYASSEYLKLINDLRFKIYDLRLSTDIIVGFPGETKKAFESTVVLCKKAKFDKAYISQYSPRPGTAAAKLKDDIPRPEKKRRWKILNDLINKKEAILASIVL